MSHSNSNLRLNGSRGSNLVNSTRTLLPKERPRRNTPEETKTTRTILTTRLFVRRRMRRETRWHPRSIARKPRMIGETAQGRIS